MSFIAFFDLFELCCLTPRLYLVLHFKKCVHEWKADNLVDACGQFKEFCTIYVKAVALHDGSLKFPKFYYLKKRMTSGCWQCLLVVQMFLAGYICQIGELKKLNHHQIYEGFTCVGAADH